MAKRILSLFLCLVLMIGMVPAFTLNTSAAEDTIYLLAGGDFQEAGDHSNSAKNVLYVNTRKYAEYVLQYVLQRQVHSIKCLTTFVRRQKSRLN